MYSADSRYFTHTSKSWILIVYCKNLHIVGIKEVLIVEQDKLKMTVHNTAKSLDAEKDEEGKSVFTSVQFN